MVSVAVAHLSRPTSFGAVGPCCCCLGGSRYLPRDSGQLAQLLRPAERREQESRYTEIHIQYFAMEAASARADLHISELLRVADANDGIAVAGKPKK